MLLIFSYTYFLTSFLLRYIELLTSLDWFKLIPPRAYTLFYIGTGCRKSTLFLIPGRLAIKSHQSGLCHGCAGWDRLGIACYGDALL